MKRFGGTAWLIILFTALALSGCAGAASSSSADEGGNISSDSTQVQDAETTQTQETETDEAEAAAPKEADNVDEAGAEDSSGGKSSGSKTKSQKKGRTTDAASGEEENREEARKEDAQSAGDQDILSILEGDWVYAGYQSFYEIEDFSSVNPYIIWNDDEYEESDRGSLSFYKDEGKLYADYVIPVNGRAEYYGLTVTPVGKADSEAAAVLTTRRGNGEEREIVLVREDVLELWEPRNEYGSRMAYTFAREGSDDAEDLEALQYKDTFTVSNVQELAEAVGDRTKIILKEGEYNLSDLTEDDLSDFFTYGILDGELYDLKIKGVDNLQITSEGADVTILTEDAYGQPLSFEDGNYITISGITAGHAVEKGYCTGSVILLQSCYNVSIDDCDLYGSGTYGVEAWQSSSVTVADTVIHDCTYGLVRLDASYGIYFDNCDMRDSEGYDMFSIGNSSDITFTDCRIADNKGSEDSWNSFINAKESQWVTFRKCVFSNNTYNAFLNDEALGDGEYSVEMDDCDIDSPLG